MINRYLTAALSLCVLIFTTPALSQDAETFDWTGIYGGAFAGYRHGEITQDGCVGSCLKDPDLNDFVAGLQAGGDYQFDNNVTAGLVLILPVAWPDGD